jgi:hypothetical protein
MTKNLQKLYGYKKASGLKWSVLVKSAFLAFPFYKTSEQFHYAITNLKKNVVKRNTRIRDLLMRVAVYDPLKETIYKTLDYNFEVENLKELYTELFNIGRNNYVECDQNEIYITCYNKFRKKLNEEGQDCSEFIPGVLRSINDYEPVDLHHEDAPGVVEIIHRNMDEFIKLEFFYSKVQSRQLCIEIDY